MRDLTATIHQLLEVIPENESILRRELDSQILKLRYCAPEVQPYHWRITSHILGKHTLDRSDEWIKVTQAIFNNDPSILQNQVLGA